MSASSRDRDQPWRRLLDDLQNFSLEARDGGLCAVFLE
jgi:hypothetical protein